MTISMNEKDKTATIVLLFVVVSSIFIYSRTLSNVDYVLDILEVYGHHECPANFTLYQLIGRGQAYDIQVSTNGYGKRRIRRCERLYVSWKAKESILPQARWYYSSLKNSAHEKAIMRLCNSYNYPTRTVNGSRFYQNSIGSALVRLTDVFDSSPVPHSSGSRRQDTADAWAVHTMLHGIFPGTLWCGMGNVADTTDYALGSHARVDACCREHDLCRPVIGPYMDMYHAYNPTIHPVSHCSCDKSFYNCLSSVNSTTSRQIGRIYFNIVKMKCFDFDINKVCMNSYLSVCTEKEVKCSAVIKENREF